MYKFETINLLEDNIGSMFFVLFFPHCVVCGILVPRPGIKLKPLAVKAWSPNHWTAREFPGSMLFDTGLSNIFFWICPLRQGKQKQKNTDATKSN